MRCDFWLNLIFLEEVNVVSVDWSQMDEGRMCSFLYWKAASNCDLIGQHVAEFLTFLNVSPSAVHVLGHSLGAHMAGFVGKAMDGALGQ